LIFQGPKAWTLISRSPASNLSPTLNKKKKEEENVGADKEEEKKLKWKNLRTLGLLMKVMRESVAN